MFKRNWNRAIGLGGALALLALGTTPAAASMNACPAGTPAYFTGSTVYLGQEGATNIWSSLVTLHTYCGSIDPDHALANVVVTAVMANSNGVIPQLEASADGSDPTVALPTSFPGVSLNTPPGLVTGSDGEVSFTLRAQSPVESFLAGPGGAPQLIGLQLDYGMGTGSFDPSGDPAGGTYQFPIGGFGGIYGSTPELDSLALFGSGAAALAGYALLRLRARRRRD